MYETFGFVNFDYPKRFNIGIEDFVIEDSLNVERVGVQNEVFLSLTHCKVSMQEPCLGMEGWITLKSPETTWGLYFKEDQKEYFTQLFNRLELITTIL